MKIRDVLMFCPLQLYTNECSLAWPNHLIAIYRQYKLELSISLHLRGKFRLPKIRKRSTRR
jgi:hypothetical protein